MIFCGIESKFKEGEVVLLNLDSLPQPVRCTVTSIGILGGKLSHWIFVYHVTDEHGIETVVTEKGLLKNETNQLPLDEV